MRVTRYVIVVLMFGLALAAVFLPAVDAVEPGPEPGTEQPPVAICPLVEVGDRHTRVSVLSSLNGQGRLSSFAGGEETGVRTFQTGRTGAVTLNAAGAGAVELAGGLIEMPSETTAAAVIVHSPEQWAAESCADVPAGQAFIAGGSTISEAFFELQLINPYAGEATVELTVATEAGLESDETFDAVIVPALSTRTLDLTQIIPGRANIAVNIETIRGSVLAFGRQSDGSELALWRAVEPALEWWLPVPPGGNKKQMLISNPEASEVEYQVDLYGPEGYEEAYASGVIPARGSGAVALAQITPEAIGIKVISSAPVVPTLRIDSPRGLANTTASPVEAPVWLLPGARAPGGGTGSVVILNTGIEPVEVTLQALGQQAQSRKIEVASESVAVAELANADAYRIEATGPVTALWTSQRNEAGSAALGIPVQDE